MRMHTFVIMLIVCIYNNYMVVCTMYSVFTSTENRYTMTLDSETSSLFCAPWAV